MLSSHRGYDFGALELARRLSKTLNCPLIANTTTRLLVDPNRSPRNRNAFSHITRVLSDEEKARILVTFHDGYRDIVATCVGKILAAGERVCHIAVHSFTPQLRGVDRTADVGLLYDPGRPGERQFCELWQQALADEAPDLRVRRNYPYRGTSDGLPTWLRQMHADGLYVGVELEVNRRLLERRARAGRLAAHLVSSLQTTISSLISEQGRRPRAARRPCRQQ